jgi:hypothetical protein
MHTIKRFVSPAAFATAVSWPMVPALAQPVESSLFTGDVITLMSKGVHFEGVLEEDKVADPSKATAPGRTKLKVINDTMKNGKRVLTVRVVDVPCVGTTVAKVTSLSQALSSAKTDPDHCKEATNVKEGHNYDIERDELDRFGFRRTGWIYGGLIIPYKYFRHDKSLEPGTTIGPFLGYRLGQTGWGVSVVGTLGIASIKLNTVENGELKEQTVQGLSRAIGLMFDIAKSENPFRFGIMVGKDRVGSNSAISYPHEGHSWLAVQLGWEFGR